MRDRTLRRWAFAWLCVVAGGLGVIVTCLYLLLSPVLAHDHDRPDLSGWYKELKSSGGAWCCDGSTQEVRHLSDVEWRTVDGHYQVRINQYMDNSGEFVWVDVPDDAVIKKPNEDGRATVWPIWGEKPNVRCFLPGTLS